MNGLQVRCARAAVAAKDPNDSALPEDEGAAASNDADGGVVIAESKSAGALVDERQAEAYRTGQVIDLVSSGDDESDGDVPL